MRSPIKALIKAHDEQSVTIEVHNKQKAIVEAQDEQQAPIKVHNK